MISEIPSRRSFLGAGLGLLTTGALAACGRSSLPATSSGATLVSPIGPEVAAAEAKRAASGRVTTANLTVSAGVVDLGGPMVNTFSYGGQVPGPVIRMSAGDTLVARLANQLPATTSVHWHGVALRNDMDGVPPVTQRAIPTGGEFTYRFVAENAGTYWFHPHVGPQLDRGLYGALIVEDPHEPLAYDDEWVVVLDDWIDGVGGVTPDEILTQLSAGMGGMNMGGANPSAMAGMAGMGGGMAGVGGVDGSRADYLLSGATSTLLGGDAGDVRYPYYLVNGRVAAAPHVLTGRRGSRVRLRMINAAGDTTFRVALGGHSLTITHTDGYPVEPQQGDAVLIAPGERYDALVTLADGVFPLTALAEGKNAAGRALVRTGSGAVPAVNAWAPQLRGQVVTASALRPTAAARLAARTPDVTYPIRLTGAMMSYDWGLNGNRFDMAKPTAHPFTVRAGQRVRLRFTNATTMYHPMHLHGHTFQVGATGPRKDTVIVPPRQTVDCDFDADNPGLWMLHCHLIYHAESGMMGVVGYLA
jgi:FtsP/CotA-like multicopper oxidase with cupredoxin domain